MKYESGKHTLQFVEFCKNNFTLICENAYCFESLPICIVDCIYSLQSRYTSTVNVNNRYINKCMGGNLCFKGDTISNFIVQINNYGGPIDSAVNLFESKAKFGHGITDNYKESNLTLKSEVCYNLATKFKENKIETIDDFRKAKQEDLENWMREVKWVGDAAVNYLFMLAGDSTKVKPDVHIHHCIKDCFGDDFSNQDIQQLFTDAIEILKKDYPTLTARNLDGIIWGHYSKH